MSIIPEEKMSQSEESREKLLVVTDRNAPGYFMKSKIRNRLEREGFTVDHLWTRAWSRCAQEENFLLTVGLWGNTEDDVAQGVTVRLVKPSTVPTGYANLDFTWSSWKVYLERNMRFDHRPDRPEDQVFEACLALERVALQEKRGLHLKESEAEEFDKVGRALIEQMYQSGAATIGDLVSTKSSESALEGDDEN